MACVVQLGICLSIAALGFLLGLHVQFSDGLGGTLALLAGLLAVLAIGGTALGVWLGGGAAPGRRIGSRTPCAPRRRRSTTWCATMR